MKETLKKKLGQIKIIVSDVDGVLTDGGMYYGAKGELMKKFSARDGKAFELLAAMGMRLAWISGEKNKIISSRARKLKIRGLYMGAKDKIKVAEKLLKTNHLQWQNILFVGDDWGDKGLLEKVGISCAPKDAIPAVREIADVVLNRNGGEGVIAEVFQLFLRARKI